VARKKPQDSEVVAQRIAARLEPEIRAQVVAVIATIRDRWTLGQLADMIERGRIEQALAVVDIAARQLGGAWSRVYQSAAGSTVAAVNRSLGVVGVHFDATNVRAVAAMRGNQLRLVQEFSREQRLATRQALLDGMRAGANPIEQARNFRQSIGLTSYQERAVANYRRALESGGTDALSRQLRDRRFDRTVVRAADEGTALSSKQIDVMVERYRERYIQYRSEVIARTESMTAAAEGSHEAFTQAVESGDVSPDRIERTWNPAEDNRVRDSHAAMDGQTVGYDQPFISGSGARIRFPGDPQAPPEERIQCRCSVSTRIAAAPDLQARVSVYEQR